LATAEVASIAVTANAVIRVFMTILLGKRLGAKYDESATNDCTDNDNSVVTKKQHRGRKK